VNKVVMIIIVAQWKETFRPLRYVWRAPPRTLHMPMVVNGMGVESMAKHYEM